jgi:hypothetical protein
MDSIFKGLMASSVQGRLVLQKMRTFSKQGKDRVIVFPSTESLLGWYSIE